MSTPAIGTTVRVGDDPPVWAEGVQRGKAKTLVTGVGVLGFMFVYIYSLGGRKYETRARNVSN